MRIVGVIAEYDPFHAGHAYHLRMAREQARADAVIVVMSSCFTQRGAPALLSPAVRARMALQCGADAVFALPAAWAVRDAEHFALGGVALLSGLGCDALSFGTETADLPLMEAVASALEQPDDALRDAIRSRIAGGLPYPAAVADALEATLPGSGALLNAPNSTLGTCYLRAMRRLGATMEVIPVQRTSGYHATALGPALPSATALRGAILRGDWDGVRASVPDAAARTMMDAIREGCIHRPSALDAALLYRLRTMSREDYAHLPDLSEGIEERLRAAAMASASREDLLQAAKTRRYPYARLSRLATHALLGLTDVSLPRDTGPDAAWLLGFRLDARNIFAHIKARGKLPLISKAADFPQDASWFRTELTAYSIWALGAGLNGDLALTQGVVRI